MQSNKQVEWNQDQITIATKAIAMVQPNRRKIKNKAKKTFQNHYGKH